MPRGGDYVGEPPQSDNAIGLTNDIVHGGDGKPTSEEPIPRASKTAPLPEGLSEEVNDGIHSGGGSRGAPASGSGKGAHVPKTLGEEKGTKVEGRKPVELLAAGTESQTTNFGTDPAHYQHPEIPQGKDRMEVGK
ncbi:hypothetical protein LTR10_024058 [Elasticomyces elasticus]|uniref:Uncharacterized protein n=1 Tax=Exophiala sideris TaxID=1016849 RepID=A0ABR0JNU8_9EURO|nr:hypothetical protein LTR10_024058 [Elasticomyces elasticus]KAK5038171.1 hypothetical protein LTS07_001640 [Exophiala sideris]KAK5044155.1 hypothetical protein LTR13_000511 [Exophiala sideris]KAK5067655.1 hypothetical protein LTR69_001644 [Exophiala sideris]KAK5184104.1 hypothetical protein LTR44_003610 [Eurotiomycetes sp. CCFEE 6388]